MACDRCKMENIVFFIISSIYMIDFAYILTSNKQASCHIYLSINKDKKNSLQLRGTCAIIRRNGPNDQ